MTFSISKLANSRAKTLANKKSMESLPRSVGIILYEALFGKAPYKSDTIDEVRMTRKK